MIVLAVAFLARVLIQGLQSLNEVSWLPAFERWQSGALPYRYLFASQLVILAIMAWAITGVRTARRRLPVYWWRAAAAFGIAYCGFMAFRLVAGFTFAAGHSWLDNPLPSSFHLVLASFLLVWCAAERTVA